MKIQNNQTLNTWLFIAVVAAVAWGAGVDHARHHPVNTIQWQDLPKDLPPGWTVRETPSYIKTKGYGSAARGNHGSAGPGPAAGSTAPGSAGSQGQGSNGRYSLADPYQPWPQEQMRQFAKPHWTPWNGKS